MIGRRVQEGEIVQWEPYGAAMTDVLVRAADGRLCWYASHTLKPTDNLGPLPSRRAAQERRKAESLAQLKTIRAQHVDACQRGERWPGMEFGKAILGKSIDGAIAALTEESEVANK